MTRIARILRAFLPNPCPFAALGTALTRHNLTGYATRSLSSLHRVSKTLHALLAVWICLEFPWETAYNSVKMEAEK